jgi:hypothetical protein
MLKKLKFLKQKFKNHKLKKYSTTPKSLPDKLISLALPDQDRQLIN